MTIGLGVGGAIFVFGVVLGFGGGYYYAKYSLEDKYEELIQEELESIREVNRRNRDADVHKTVVNNMHNQVGVDVNEKTEAYDSEANFRNNKSSLDRVLINKNEKAKRDYNTQRSIPLQKSRIELVSDEPTGVNFEDDDVVHEDDEQESGIYEITLEDYSDTHLEYDKIGLFYHKYDMILCDEQEELLDDISHTISDEIEEDLYNRTGTVYVRNDFIAVDYEIIVINSSYSEHHRDEPEVLRIRKRPKDEHDD